MKTLAWIKGAWVLALTLGLTGVSSHRRVPIVSRFRYHYEHSPEKSLLVFLAALAFLSFGLLSSLAQAQPPTWMLLTPLGPYPSNRADHTAVYDAAGKRLILLGGFALASQSFPLNDVWVLVNADGVSGTPIWTQLTPGGLLPSPRQGHTALYDSVTNRMIVFGGYSESGELNDLWVLTDANGVGTPTWVELSPGGTPPPPRWDHTAVYDTANNRMIVFGGSGESGGPNDLWVLTDANGVGTPTWSQLTSLGGPLPARFGHTAAYDASTNTMIVFGGFSGGQGLNDLWLLTNANGLAGLPTWSAPLTAGLLPPARGGHVATYDPVTQSLLVFGGFTNSGGSVSPLTDTWHLANAPGTGATPAWSQLSPAGTPPSVEVRGGIHTFMAGVFDRTTDRLVVVGDGSCCGPGPGKSGFFWVLENGVPVPTVSPPPTLGVTPALLDFGSVPIGNTKDLDFTVQNTGGGTLSGSAGTSGPFSIVSGSPFNLAAGQSQAVTVRFSPTSSGTFSSNVTFTSNGGNASTVVQGDTGVSSSFTLTVTKAGTGSGTVTSSPAGINCGTDCTESYESGTVVTLMATADSDSTFAGWSGDSDCSDRQVTMDANKTCTATFNVIDHQAYQPRPIPLGVSGGNINDATEEFCCVGTLGGLVTDGSNFFILSNNHVLAKSNYAAIGDDIVQPGLGDVGCEKIPEDAVADLTKFEPIRFGLFFNFNLIDAAIAAIRPGQVDTSGTILEIGIPGTFAVDPELGMAVKKSGRTTGLTHGTIAAINVTIIVSYSWKGQCGNEFKLPATFTNQIRIVGTGGSSFSLGGDSGSLVVEDVDSCPPPVGLLFAGNKDGTESFANSIKDVLGTFGMTVVGCQ